MNSRTQHNVIAAGRRSFKTETAKRKLVTNSLYGAEGNYFYGAPTQGQAKKIAWNDLKLLSKPFHSRTPNESELIITLKTGSTIHCLGLDAPARIEGQMWHGGILDEYADMKADVWTHHVQPVTADTGAWVDFIGVPEGQNHFFALAEFAKTDKDWSFFTWKSSDVLPPHVIEAAKRQLDERTYNQEYEASFAGYGQSAYYCFDSANIVCQDFITNAPTVMCWDFNASPKKPMSTGLVQEINGKYYLTKEFIFKNSNTDEQCQKVLEFFKEVNFSGSLEVTGDYSGNRRESNATRSDYAIIEYYFGNYPDYRLKTRPTLSIRDRIASLNAQFRNMAGERNLYVDSRCTKHIEDLYKTRWKDSGVELDDSDPERTHPSDELSYWAYNTFPIERKKVVYG